MATRMRSVEKARVDVRVARRARGTERRTRSGVKIKLVRDGIVPAAAASVVVVATSLLEKQRNVKVPLRGVRRGC